MRTAFIAIAGFGIVLGMWLELGIRILSQTTAVVEAAAEACVKTSGPDASEAAADVPLVGTPVNYEY